MSSTADCQLNAIVLVYPDKQAEFAITKAFELYGGEYVLLHDIKELKPTAMEMDPDVVILRAESPSYDLHTVIRNLYMWEITPHLPIIVVYEPFRSDWAHFYNQMRGVLNMWVNKPFSPKEIKTMACRLIRARHEGGAMVKQAQDELEKDKYTIDAHYRLANGYKELNCAQKAINILLTALQIDPMNGATHFQICLAYDLDLDYKNALKHWRLAKQYGNEKVREDAEKLRHSGYDWRIRLENEP